MTGELAIANRQIAILEEYKKLYIQKTFGACSQERGRILEDLTEQSLADLFPDAAVTRTSHVAHSGDF